MSLDGCLRALEEALDPWPAPPVGSRPFWMGGERDRDDDHCRRCGDYIDPASGVSICEACR